MRRVGWTGQQKARKLRHEKVHEVNFVLPYSTTTVTDRVLTTTGILRHAKYCLSGRQIIE